MASEQIPKSIVLLPIVAVALLTHISALRADDKRMPIDDTCWQQTFSEDFNELDLWDPETDKGRWKTSYIWGSDIIINNELQYYIDPREHDAEPFEINNGVLAIMADKTPAKLQQQVQDRPYISGALTTENEFSQLYGRFEVKAQVPAGKGLWSAFWLLPSFDKWPEGVAVLPEIDVMEHIGDQPRTYHTTLHSNQSGELRSHPYDHTLDVDLTRDFHLYSVIWTAETVSWYLDSKWMASHATPDDFTQPVHFLLNLAVGGNWPGEPNSDTKFPASFHIDYVRAYANNGRC